MKNTLGVLALVLFLLPACSDQDPAAPGMDLVHGPALAKVDAKVELGSGGPYPVGFTSFVVADESRDGRLVPVYVWYPADPDGIDGATEEAMYPLDPFHAGAPEAPSSAFEAQGLDPAYQEPEPAAGPFAIVLHSPGWGGNAYTDAHYIGTGLASQGFVVASMTHWGDQSTFGFSGEPLFHLALSSFDRPRDMSFALDALLAKNSDVEDVLFGAMNPGQVIASGWSLGGYAAMVLVLSLIHISEPTRQVLVSRMPSSA